MASPNYVEMSLKGIPKYECIENLIGPDSEVDKKLLALAVYYAEANPTDMVFVATHDGGIQAEISLLQTQRQLLIFSPASIDQLMRKLGESFGKEADRLFVESKKVEMLARLRKRLIGLVLLSVCFVLLVIPLTNSLQIIVAPIALVIAWLGFRFLLLGR
jgi:hypothetical protein